MQLGEVKLEALKLMFISFSDDNEIADIPDLLVNDEYKSYLVAMPGSINRCYNRFENEKVSKRVTVNLKTIFTKSSGYYDFDLDKFYSDEAKITEITASTNKIYEDSNGDLYRFDGTYFEKISKFLYIDTTKITNFNKLDRVVLSDLYESYNSDQEYMWENDTLIIPYINLFPTIQTEYEGRYLLIYFANITRITSVTAETTVIDLPLGLVEMIPYYIKGELYQDDQPALANESRNIFEQLLATYRKQETNKQTAVVAKYDVNKL